MISTLIAGNVILSEQQKTKLGELGLALSFQKDEREEVTKPEQYEIVICNGLFQFHSIDEFKKLKMIQLTSAGLDRVPLDTIQERGIRICNAEDTYSVPMAEFAVGGILQLYKNSEFFFQNKIEKKWEKDRKLRELAGKQVLILGTGHVGQALAKRLHAFDCCVTGLSRSGKTVPGFDHIATINQMDETLPQTDILILAIPHNPKTEGILNEKRLQLLKEDATIVNVARGKLVEEQALVRWLENHPFGGAVLDVFEMEPLPEENALWRLPNVVLSPHNSFVGEGNAQRLFQVMKKNLEQYII